MYCLPVIHSSACSMHKAPMSLNAEFLLGKIRIILVRRFISWLNRSRLLVVRILLRCCSGKFKQLNASSTDSTITNITDIALRNGSADFDIDGIRIGITWGDAPLPVSLTSFTARQEGNYVVLEWVTESEIDNLGFIIERRSVEDGEQGSEGEWSEIASYITHPELQGQGSVTHRTEYIYTDSTVVAGVTYVYRLADVSYAGVVEYHGLTTLIVEAFEPLPDRFTVFQNYPNPFNAKTIISYYLPVESYVTLTIYDLMGRELEKLLSGRVVSGRHKVRWDASDVASGVYIYRISTGSFGETEHNSVAKKLVILK